MSTATTLMPCCDYTQTQRNQVNYAHLYVMPQLKSPNERNVVFCPESELMIQNLRLFPFLLLHEALYKQLTAVKLEVSIVSMTALLFHPCRCTNSGEKISEKPALQIPLLHLSKPQRTKLSFVISSCRPISLLLCFMLVVVQMGA